MSDLNILKLYDQSSDNKKEIFSGSIDSSLKVSVDYDRVECDFGWLELMEEVVPYLDNIMRNPNRFIVNEEEVIKIELAKRITVDSLKHLSKHTNLIQDYDKDTGDVKPSKILNVNKEESFDTYENRLIYTLIKNMVYYIETKKKDIVYESSEKRNKLFEYSGNSTYSGDNVSFEMKLQSKYNNKSDERNAEGLGVKERLKKLEDSIKMLTGSEVYRTLDKLHVALVMPPVKKTNLIMKNTNFQYAMKLWDFLQQNVPTGAVNKKEKKSYKDNSNLKKYIDETFLLDYLVIDSLDSDISKQEQNDSEEMQEKLIGNLVSKMIDIDDKISEEKLQNLVAKQYTVIKYKNVTSENNIKKIFREQIDKYVKNISKIR